MKVKLKRGYDPKETHYLDPELTYEVEIVDGEVYVIVCDNEDPVLYDRDQFEIVDATEPEDWVTTYFEDGECREPRAFQDSPHLIEYWHDRDETSRRLFREHLLATLHRRIRHDIESQKVNELATALDELDDRKKLWVLAHLSRRISIGSNCVFLEECDEYHNLNVCKQYNEILNQVLKEILNLLEKRTYYIDRYFIHMILNKAAHIHKQSNLFCILEELINKANKSDSIL